MGSEGPAAPWVDVEWHCGGYGGGIGRSSESGSVHVLALAVSGGAVRGGAVSGGAVQQTGDDTASRAIFSRSSSSNRVSYLHMGECAWMGVSMRVRACGRCVESFKTADVCGTCYYWEGDGHCKHAAVTAVPSGMGC